MRYALGPPRVAPKEGKGWLFAAGELAMPAEDLAKWDISLIEERLMKPASYREMETEVLLKNGLGTQYGLGVVVTNESGHRAVSHGGEVSGFTAENMVFPDDHVAVVVMTNQDSATASATLAKKIVDLLFQGRDPASLEALAEAREIFSGLQHGKLDRTRFTANCNSYFSEQAIRDFASSLGPLGTPEEFRETQHRDRGGMSFRSYRARFPGKTLAVTVRAMPDGKIEQYQVMAAQ
jgi:CubicO group peptidase (beta-lactamase class C family)